ncbi:hypothetical protein [Pseudofrankia sp. BMG5.36]|uniref:hypothetical protein n=1 Tax=Pseudofrankia sp. BMG5.36 TaxID=1834512 RepID=UPI0008DA8E94|nr:hypothetical protein [Pseudofrankia sp. BMG5.36]OHV61259.1 hypothetical protein BCD48_40060 [Pseudofrankia sp. BMG5.36]
MASQKALVSVAARDGLVDPWAKGDAWRWCQQLSEGLLEVSTFNPVPYHPEAGEHSLVESTPYFRWRGQVQLVGVGTEQQDLLHHSQHRGSLRGAALHDRGGASQLAADPLLLDLQEVEGERVGVVGLQQLELFALEVVDAFLLPGSFGLAVGLVALQLGEHLSTDGRDALVRELDPAPPVGD